MAARIDTAKANPADVAALALDGIEADLTEILADDVTRGVRQASRPRPPSPSPERESIVAEKEECADRQRSRAMPSPKTGR